MCDSINVPWRSFKMSRPTFSIRGWFCQSFVLPNALSSGTWQTSQAPRDAPNAGLAKLRQPPLTNKDSLCRCCMCHNGASALQHPIFNQEWVSIIVREGLKAISILGEYSVRKWCHTLVSHYLKKCLGQSQLWGLIQQLKSHNIWHMTFISLYSLFYKNVQFLTKTAQKRKEIMSHIFIQNPDLLHL